MARILSHLNTAKYIITQFKGDVPIASYLKTFFSLDKKYGSKDRKSISALCYYYYRLGSALKGAGFEEKTAAAVFLCGTQPHPLLEELRPDWNGMISQPPVQKLALVPGFELEDVFAFNKELEQEIDPIAFAGSFLRQPLLFIRVRPGHHAVVVKKLRAAGIEFQAPGEDCLAFENATRLEEVLLLNKEYVVQDFSSQRVGEFMKRLAGESPVVAWDCCAASGGKTILANDCLPGIQLFVSDIRQSILHNLQKRLAMAGIRNYKSHVVDLANERAIADQFGQQQFDLVICDAPCSGSGTWSRTPEQLSFFKANEIERYSKLQQKILQNVSRYVKPGGHLLYITCSVFTSENQLPVQSLVRNFPYKLVRSALLAGYEQRADTLFAALLERDK